MSNQHNINAKLKSIFGARAVKNFKKQGVTFKLTNRNHIEVHYDGSRVALIAGTTSDRRSIKNLRGDMRRAGIQV